MAQKYYLDTSIWLDYYENRSDNLRPLGEWAFRLLKTIIETDDIVCYSKTTLKEFNNCGYDEKTLKEILSIVKPQNLIKIKISAEQFEEGKKISKERNLPLGDVLNAILSRDNELVLVARDRHFEELTDIAMAYKPEELI